jgi:hypothetical protein
MKLYKGGQVIIAIYDVKLQMAVSELSVGKKT